MAAVSHGCKPRIFVILAIECISRHTSTMNEEIFPKPPHVVANALSESASMIRYFSDRLERSKTWFDSQTAFDVVN